MEAQCLNLQSKMLSVRSVEDDSATDYDLPSEEDGLIDADELEKDIQRQSVELVRSWMDKQCQFEEFEEDPGVKKFEIKFADRCREKLLIVSEKLNILAITQWTGKTHLRKKPMSEPQNTSGVGMDEVSYSTSVTGWGLEDPVISANNGMDKMRKTSCRDEASSHCTVEELVLRHPGNKYECFTEPVVETDIEDLAIHPLESCPQICVDTVEDILVDSLPKDEPCIQTVCEYATSPGLQHLPDKPEVSHSELWELLNSFEKSVQVFWTCSENFSRRKS